MRHISHCIFFSLLAIVVIIISAPAEKPWSDAFKDLEIFHKNWHDFGSGHVTECWQGHLSDVGFARGRGHVVYYTYRFECLDTHSHISDTTIKHTGICYSFEKRFSVGDVVDIVFYNNDHQQLKIKGSYVTYIKPKWYYEAVVICVLASLLPLVFVFVCIRYDLSNLRQKVRRKGGK
jgi:hypothetical protein